MGVLKPQFEAFEHVIADLAVSPERIAFFDDTPVNVEAAAALGIRAFPVAGLAALRSALSEAGILRQERYRR
jgi:putative hydrolase of the HAD superfamily